MSVTKNISYSFVSFNNRESVGICRQAQGRDLSRSASLHENKQSLQRHEMNPVQQTERDKSRPYAYRIACFLEDFISVINRVHCVFIILDSSL